MNRFTRGILVVCFCASAMLGGGVALAENPFDTAVKILPGTSKAPEGFSFDPTSPKFQQTFEQFKEDCTNGFGKANEALGQLTKDLDKLIADVKGKADQVTKDAGKISIPDCFGGTTPTASVAQAPAAGTSIVDEIANIFSPKPKTVGEAFSNFFKSLGEAASAFGNWLKAWWAEFTGPETKDAPITSTVNDLKEKYQKWTMQQKLKKLGTATKDLGGSIATFAKNIFK